MMEFGKSLRAAREAKGYTVSQIADMTHLKSSVVDGLENEDFSMIAAPIYGRGFVRLYCEAIGLEAKPFVDEFMSIMNGEHEVAIKERPVAEPQPAPEAAAAPEPDLFSHDEPSAAPLPNPAPEQTISRYAAPFREADAPVAPGLPNPRIVLLACVALALLVGLVFGVRALYRATTTDAEPATPATQETPAAKTEQSAPRTPQKIPSLYID